MLDEARSLPAEVETVVIGGGITGLSAARRLAEERREYLLLTDRLGGRLHHTLAPPINLGATYLNEDYVNVRRFVGLGPPLCRTEMYLHDGERRRRLVAPATLRHGAALLRLLRILRAFRRELQAFRRAAAEVPQAELRPRFPLLDRLARLPAVRLIRELGLEELHAEYLIHAFRATYFRGAASQAHALGYLAGLLPLLVPCHRADFAGTYDRLISPIRDRIVRERVVRLRRLEPHGFRVTTPAGRQVHSRWVILALPYHNASRLHRVPGPQRWAGATIVAVVGERREPFREPPFLLLGPAVSPVALMWRQPEGHDWLFSLAPAPDLRGLYAGHAVLQQVTWTCAVTLPGPRWVPLQLAPGVLLASDYNLCSMEDCFLAGRCAANRILQDPVRRTVSGYRSRSSTSFSRSAAT
jgi:hypothetical protein